MNNNFLNQPDGENQTLWGSQIALLSTPEHFQTSDRIFGPTFWDGVRMCPVVRPFVYPKSDVFPANNQFSRFLLRARFWGPGRGRDHLLESVNFCELSAHAGARPRINQSQLRRRKNQQSRKWFDEAQNIYFPALFPSVCDADWALMSGREEYQWLIT